VSGFKVCVSTLYDVRTMTKSPNEAFLRTYPRRKATHDCIQYVHAFIHTYTHIHTHHTILIVLCLFAESTLMTQDHIRPTNMWTILNYPQDGVQTHNRIWNPVEKTSNSTNGANIMAGGKLRSWHHSQMHNCLNNRPYKCILTSKHQPQHLLSSTDKS